MNFKFVLVFVFAMIFGFASGIGTLNLSSVCDYPMLRGSCRASKIRFWFNKDSGKCENFIYGGCEGNGNNFMTIEECVAACGGPK